MKIPVDETQWEVKRTQKYIRYHIRDLDVGDYFGHEEILNNIEKRQTQTRAKTNVTVLYVNKNDFLEYFDKSHEKMKEKHCDAILLTTIKENIEKAYRQRKERNIAILDALGKNAMDIQKGRPTFGIDK